MPLTNPNDILLVLSGGSNNSTPNKSIGGNLSDTIIVDNTLNNLFDDVSPDEAESGQTDYRCIYLANDGDSSIFNIDLYISGENPNGSDITIGFENRDELQRLTIDGNVTGGSFQLKIAEMVVVDGDPLENITITVNFFSNINDWANEFQNKIRTELFNGFPVFPDVIVTGQQATGFTTFDILFPGVNGKRNQYEFTQIANGLTPTPNIFVTTLQNGAPVNTIATLLSNEAETPSGVNFSVPTKNSPLKIPIMRIADVLPIWIKRITVIGSESLTNDSVTLTMKVDTFDPAFFN